MMPTRKQCLARTVRNPVTRLCLAHIPRPSQTRQCSEATRGGFEPGEFVHVIADAHIYDRHVPIIEELIKAEAHPAPKLTIDRVEDFYQFTPEHFHLEDYVFNPGSIRFPVAI